MTAEAMTLVPVQLRRFLATGVINTLVHTIVAVALIKLFSANQTAANVIAFILATLVSYLVNTLWSFGRALSGRTLKRFVTVAMIGATVTALVARTAESLGAHYLVGIGCVAVTVAPMTFLLHKYWTYRQ
jgi:putative flippase GtrA